MDTIAATLGVDPAEVFGRHTILTISFNKVLIHDEVTSYFKVKQRQLYKEGDVTPYGQILTNCNVQKCWEECLQQCNYYESKAEIQKFNR